MKDHDARFARKLAAVAGRIDWWNVYEEHTAYEWACQIAQFNAEPWGDDRDDLRSAVNAASVASAMSTQTISDEQFNEMVNGLAHYLKVNQQPEKTVGPAEAARLSGAKR